MKQKLSFLVIALLPALFILPAPASSDTFLSAQTSAAKPQSQRAASYVEKSNGVTLEMVSIPGGQFLMGSPDNQGDADERPQHRVKLPDFFIGKYEVTQKQWRSVAQLPKVK